MSTPTTRRGGATSRRGGQPVVLPPPGETDAPLRQLPLGLDAPTRPRARTEPLPGVVHIPNWLDLAEQQRGSPTTSARGRFRPPGCAIPACRPATS